jgi:hypothetical protein
MNTYRRTTRFASCAAMAASLLAFVILSATPQTALAWDWSWGGKSITASGNNKTETRAVTGFTGVSLALPGTVTVRQGASEGLTIETDEAFLPYIESVIERGVLKLRMSERNASFKGKFKLNITVDAINVDSLSVAGSGDIIANTLKSNKLKVSIAGSGDLNIKRLAAEDVKLSIAGSGDIHLGGTANDVEGSIAGSGRVKAEQLRTKNATLKIAGSGDAILWVTDNLKMSVAGSGDVRYWGDAKVTQSVAGSGSVKRLGTAPAAN